MVGGAPRGMKSMSQWFVQGDHVRVLREGWDREGNVFLCLVGPTEGFTEETKPKYLGESDCGKAKLFS